MSQPNFFAEGKKLERKKHLEEFIKRQSQRRIEPCKMKSPGVIKFSGGRTSGFMLWSIIQYYGGTLPSWIKVIFNNTGKERLETLDFVQEVSERWKVPIIWLEYDLHWHKPVDSVQNFKIVDYKTASRNSEPFNKLIEYMQTSYEGTDTEYSSQLPSRTMRRCSTQMKLRTTRRYLHSRGIYDHQLAIGIRYDEPTRWMDLYECGGGDQRKGEEFIAPLYYMKVTEETVMNFWASQPFDLQLKQYEGNCDLCFLKGKGKLLRLIRERPESVEWWIEQEDRYPESRFRVDHSYRALKSLALVNSPSTVSSEEDEVCGHCTD